MYHFFQKTTIAGWSSLIVGFCLLSLCACSSSGGNGIIQATGKPSEVLLVMDKGYLSDSIGQEVKEMLQRPFESLPQIESTCKVQTVGLSDFDSFLKYVRSILIVDISKDRFSKTSLKYRYNEWAEGQIVLQISTPSPDSLRLFIAENGESVLALINRHEVYRYARESFKTYSSLVSDMTQEMFGYKVYAPESIQKYKKGNRFLWFSNDAMRKRMDMIFFEVPYHGEEINPQYIIAQRDSVLQANIEGSEAGSYPATAPYAQCYSKLYAEGRPGIHELRGLWEMRGGALMGGPFVCHVWVDSTHHVVRFAEGFIYHPSKSKKDLLQRMEGTLYTISPMEQSTEEKPSVEWIKKVKRTAYWRSENQ